MQDDQPDHSADINGEEGPSKSGGPSGLDLPAQAEVLREARLLAANGDVRINQLSEIIGIDPILTLELLKVANATFYAGDRPPITNVRSAVVRVGSGTLLEILEQMAARPALPSAVGLQFEVLRTLSAQVAVVSQMIANVAARDLQEIARTAGLMSYVGHLVACAYLGERYLEHSGSKHSASLAYKLLQEYNFDVRAVQLSYLRMRGVPQEIFFALDRDMQCKTSRQANLRFTVQAATELVEAVHGGRWEKYAPGQALPSKSALRLLKISEPHYEELYETIDGYLRKPASPLETAKAEPPPESSRVDLPLVTPASQSIPAAAASGPSNVTLVLNQQANFITGEAEHKEEGEHLSENAQKVLNLIEDISSKCKSTQELLGAVMALLISEGPYERAALILVGNERQSANIHTAVGAGFEQSAEFAVLDPLSPLALCLTQIKSFNAQGIEDVMSPFGITSYAVSPLNVKTRSPVVLYADCGVDRSLPMEARKIFRLVVGLLNRILPGLPGGLPKNNYKPLLKQSNGEKRSASNA